MVYVYATYNGDKIQDEICPSHFWLQNKEGRIWRGDDCWGYSKQALEDIMFYQDNSISKSTYVKLEIKKISHDSIIASALKYNISSYY